MYEQIQKNKKKHANLCVVIAVVADVVNIDVQRTISVWRTSSNVTAPPSVSTHLSSATVRMIAEICPTNRTVKASFCNGFRK